MRNAFLGKGEKRFRLADFMPDFDKRAMRSARQSPEEIREALTILLGPIAEAEKKRGADQAKRSE